MPPLDLAFAGLVLVGGLWVTLRMRSVARSTRALGAIVGAAVIGAAVYQALEERPVLGGGGRVVPPSRAGALANSSLLAHAVPLALIFVVAIAAAVVYYTVYFLLKERDRALLRIRLPTTIRNAICVGSYVFAAILPMSLEKHEALHLAVWAVQGVVVAYVSLVAAIILMALVLAFDGDVRRHKAVVIAFFAGLVVAGGSSPFVWAALAAAIPAAQPLGVLSIFAMAAPGPAYFLLRYRLGWL